VAELAVFYGYLNETVWGKEDSIQMDDRIFQSNYVSFQMKGVFLIVAGCCQAKYDAEKREVEKLSHKQENLNETSYKLQVAPHCCL